MELKKNEATVSIVIAMTDISLLYECSQYIIHQNYENIEIIIVYDQRTFREEDIRKTIKYNKIQRKVIFVPFKRDNGIFGGPISEIELFPAGLAHANGDYLLLVNNYTGYDSNFVSNMVSGILHGKAELAFSDFIIIWSNGESYKYVNEIDLNNHDSLFESWFKNASNIFGLTMLGNFLISKDLYSRIAKEIISINNELVCHIYMADIILLALLWSRVTNAMYIRDTFPIIKWEIKDKNIRELDCTNNMILNEIDMLINLIHKICYENNISDIHCNNFINSLLGRLIWRINWKFKIKESLYNKYRNLTDFSMDVYKERTFPIDIKNFDMSVYDIKKSSNMNTQDLNIKIFISMHKPSFVQENNKYLIPIQVGAALANEKFPEMLHDDEGDNISIKNRMYCELTAQYWAWKNCNDADYYGFWHYRRYMSFNKEETSDQWGVIKHDALNEDTLKKSLIDEEHILSACSSYDIILPQKWDIIEDGKRMTLYEHWCKHFNKDDIEITCDIIYKKYPHYFDAVRDVLYSDSAIFCNMFIMKKEYFDEYSQFCFDILSEVESIINQKYYNTEEYRTLGHIAERLLAFYVRYKEKYSNVDICYLGRTMYTDTRPLGSIHPIREDSISVMLSCDNKYMPYTDVLLQSIRENAKSKYFYDIIICHRDISEQNQQIAKNIFSQDDNIELRFVDVTRNFEKYKDVHIDRHLTYETYYRFLALDIFNEYDRILYLDCDMVVNADIAELFFTDLGEAWIGAVRDYDFIASSLKRKEFYQDNIIKYINIDDIFDYFQAGMILFNLKAIRGKITSKKLFQVALSRSWYFHDQDVLNCLFNGKIKYVDDTWNVFTMLEDDSERELLLKKILPAKFAESYKYSISNPRIVHYAGVPKVWDDPSIHLGTIFWKYARKSPYYEILLRTLMNGEGDTKDWILFVSDWKENQAAKFFTIETIKSNWSSDYCVIDIIYLSNHNEIVTDTLLINASMFPDGQDRSRIDIKQFKVLNNTPLISDNILFKVNSNLDIEVYVRFLETYSGFSFNVRSIESRDLMKPKIKVNHHHFINETINIDMGLRTASDFSNK